MSQTTRWRIDLLIHGAWEPQCTVATIEEALRLTVSVDTVVVVSTRGETIEWQRRSGRSQARIQPMEEAA